jgi:predicted phosphodiesterase
MNLKRRTFLKEMGLLGLASGAAPYLVKGVEGKSSDLQLIAGPYLQRQDTSTIKVGCIFSEPCFAWLEVKDSNGSITDPIYEVEDGMRQANTTRFQFNWTPLQAGQMYRVVAKEILQFDPYKVVYGKTWEGEWYTYSGFVSMETPHRYLILNDIHEQTESYRELMEISAIKDPQLVFLNGDLFHYVTTEKEIVDKLLVPVTQTFATQVPFVLARGNHETRGRWARNFKSYFSFPQNKFYQAFLQGDVFWIILDGGEDKPDDHEVYAGNVAYDAYREEQAVWLKEMVKHPDCIGARHRIVINHIPFFHSDDWHGTLHNRACFHPILQEANIDAVISGHTHEYGFYPPDSEHKYAVIIGGGPKKGERAIVEVVSSKDELSISLRNDLGKVVYSSEKIVRN